MRKLKCRCRKTKVEACDICMGTGMNRNTPWPMRCRIFMNHRLREKPPSGPVIRVEHDNKTIQEGNTVIIKGPSSVHFNAKCPASVQGYTVHAWIEAMSKDVHVYPS